MRGILFGVWAVYLWSFSVFANSVPLFSQDNILELRLRGDFSSFRELEERRGKSTDDFAPVPGTIFYSAGNKQVEQAVLISPRGNNRFKNCPVLPPLRIEFKADIPNTPLFSGLEGMKVKLTTPCFYSERIQSLPRPPTLKKTETTEYVLREYTIYKLLESFGIPAFKTRLVKMTYEDRDGHPFFTSYSFFIEPRRIFEKRYDARYFVFKEMSREKRREFVGDTTVDQDLELSLQRLIFVEPFDHNEYDHHDSVMNNRGFLLSKETNQLISIPCYDFDWSLVVGSPIKTGSPITPDVAMQWMAVETGWFESALWRSNDADTRVAFARRLYAQKRNVIQTFERIPLKDKTLFKKNLETIFRVLDRRLGK